MTDIAITETPSSPSSNSGIGPRRTLFIDFDFDKAAQQRRAAERRHHEHLAQAYVGGMSSLLAVAKANHTSVRMVRRALRATGLGSRRSGPPGLTAEQHQQLLDADLAGTPHRIIASQLGISAERVRQIARAAGRTSLRGRRPPDRKTGPEQDPQAQGPRLASANTPSPTVPTAVVAVPEPELVS